MKSIKVDLGDNLDKVVILPIADVHFGDKDCNLDRVKEVINKVKTNKNCYCVLNGDLINNATKHSVSDVYSAPIPPSVQLRMITELLEPIKDKILCVTSGNHEFRTYKDDAIDLTEILCRDLGIGDRYANESALVFLRFGKLSNGTKETKNKGKVREVCYTLFVTHGCGGGSSAGGKVNRVEHLKSIVDADIYIHSHTHLPAVFKEGYFRTDTRNSTVALVDKLFVNTTSYLNYGGYGDRYNFAPNTIANTVIALNGTKKEFSAIVE